MSVILTIVSITYLFKGESKPDNRAGFLNPAALRRRLEALPEDSSRTEALMIMDRIDALASAYDEASVRAIEAYTAHVEQWDSSADDLIADLKPLDELRGQTLPDLIELRQRLVDTLSPEEWAQVFI